MEILIPFKNNGNKLGKSLVIGLFTKEMVLTYVIRLKGASHNIIDYIND